MSRGFFRHRQFGIRVLSIHVKTRRTSAARRLVRFDILIRRADDLVVLDRSRCFRRGVVGACLILRLGPPAPQKRGEQAESVRTRIYQVVRSQHVSIAHPGG